MIVCYSGWPGAGKTLCMVEAVRQRVLRDRCQVFSNMVGLHVPQAVYLSCLDDLAKVGRGLVVLDEASVCLASRYWHKHNQQVLAAFAQSRKNGLDMFITAQHIDRVDTVVREICNVEIRCRRIGNFVLQVYMEPSKVSMIYKRKVWRMRPRTYGLYDTFERISVTGGGGAESVLAAYPCPSYALRRKGTDNVGSELFRQRCFRWDGSRRVLTRAGRHAVASLRAYGVRSAGTAGLWWQRVCEEGHRIAWLREFGLHSWEVPVWCDYWNPWVVGWNPVEAANRYLAAEGSG